MVRPRWLSAQRVTASRLWLHWDRAVALWASLNLVWVLFDITYVPLRTFWLQRNLTPLPQMPLVVPLPLLPDITPLYDPVKGIEPHRETQLYLASFQQLDRALLAGESPARTAPLRRRQVELTVEMINENPFAASGNSGTLEKIKNRLRQQAGLDSAKQSADRLLSDGWLARHRWHEERRFWRQQVLPLVSTSYWRSIDENGRPTDHFWRTDLLLFQSVFALDILLRMLRLRRRFPGLSWRDALLRRWIDLPLLLPFWCWLRVVPVVERLSHGNNLGRQPIAFMVGSGSYAAYLAQQRGLCKPDQCELFAQLNPYKHYGNGWDELIRQGYALGDIQGWSTSSGTVLLPRATFRAYGPHNGYLACTVAHEIAHVLRHHVFTSSYQEHHNFRGLADKPKELALMRQIASQQVGVEGRV